LARQKLAQAGFPEGAGLPTFSVLAPPAAHFVSSLEHIVRQLETNLGLKIEVEILEWKEIFARLHNEPPFLLLFVWQADYLDPDSFLRYARWLPFSGWRHERYEALIEDARGIADQGRRMALYRQAEQILVDEAPVVPISYYRHHIMLKPWVTALPRSSINGIILKDVVIEPH
jgi:oligopeptide transport system substrate-binding protein